MTTKSLNLCLVAKAFPLAGRGNQQGFLWPIAKGMAKKGHKVTVLTWDNPFDEQEVVQDGVISGVEITNFGPADVDITCATLSMKDASGAVIEEYNISKNIFKTCHPGTLSSG